MLETMQSAISHGNNAILSFALANLAMNIVMGVSMKFMINLV